MTFTLREITLLALGGTLGTVARASLSQLATRAFGAVLPGTLLPWGTASVNLLGCLLFGLGFSVIEGKLGGVADQGAAVKLCVLTGFMGAFTTFSTYMFETAVLLERSQPWVALGNFLLQNTLGFVALTLGLAAGRAVTP